MGLNTVLCKVMQRVSTKIRAFRCFSAKMNEIHVCFRAKYRRKFAEFSLSVSKVSNESSPTLVLLCALFITEHLGCILLGLFWLFLFRFRNNRIHGISISKRTLLHVSDLEMESEAT